MKPEWRQLLFTMIETAIANGNDVISPKWQKSKRVDALRPLG